jgi:hypothetical protein
MPVHYYERDPQHLIGPDAPTLRGRLRFHWMMFKMELGWWKYFYWEPLHQWVKARLRGEPMGFARGEGICVTKGGCILWSRTPEGAASQKAYFDGLRHGATCQFCQHAMRQARKQARREGRHPFEKVAVCEDSFGRETEEDR